MAGFDLAQKAGPDSGLGGVNSFPPGQVLIALPASWVKPIKTPQKITLIALNQLAGKLLTPENCENQRVLRC